MSLHTYYYALEGGDFSVFLDHFKKQADGDKESIINRRKGRRGNLIVVDSTPDKASTKSGKDVPKLEVVTPNEANRRRAEAEVKSEEIKTLTHQSPSQSTPTGRKRQVKLEKKATANSKAKVKRVKDAFDN